MSATSLDDVPPTQTPAVGIPTRSRPAQPAPHRPVPQPATTSTTEPSPSIPTPVEDYGPQPGSTTRTLAGGFLDRMKGRARVGVDDLDDSDDQSARTRTSSSRDRRRSPGLDLDTLAGTIGRALALVAEAAGWLLSRRGYDLRPPTDDETDAVARPVARILDRHVGTQWLNDDILDGVAAASGVTAYAKTKPLRRAGLDAGDELDPTLPEGYEEIS